LPSEKIAFVVDINGNVRKRGLEDAEVLRQNVARRVGKQMGEQEGLREAAVIENQEELTALFEALDRVRDNRREIPEIAGPTSSMNVRPSSSIAVIRARPASMYAHRLLVPMHLADASGFQTHVYATSSVATGSSRTVTSRAQSPERRRLRAVAKENLRFGMVPASQRATPRGPDFYIPRGRCAAPKWCAEIAADGLGSYFP